MIYSIKRKVHNLVFDHKFSEILTGSIWALSSRIIATLLGLVFNVLVARLFGAKVVGIVAVVNSFLILVTIFTVVGTQTSILRLIPEHLSKYSPTSAFKVYRKTHYLIIGISFVTAMALFFSADLIAGKVFSKSHLSHYFALASIFVVFNSIALLNTNAVRGLRLIKLFAFMQLLPQTANLIFLIGMGLLLKNDAIPVYAVLFGLVITGITGWLIMESTFKKKMKIGDIVRPIAYRDILAISMPMLMTATMMFFITQIGILMIGALRSEVEVGYYSVAVKLATLTTFVLNAINSIAGPKFAELFHTGKMDELFFVAKKSTKLIFWTTSPILLFLIGLGKPVLTLLYGAEFVSAYQPIIIIVIGQFINAISGSTGIFMNMTGHQKIFRNIVACTAIMSLILNFILNPIFGINGAAVSATISIIFLNVSVLVYMKAKFGKTTAYVPFYTKKYE